MNLENKIKPVFANKVVILGLAILSASPAFSSQNIHIGVFDAPLETAHSKQVLNLFRAQLRGLSNVRISLYPIYDKEGNLFESEFLQQLKRAEKEKVDIYHFSWNMRSSSKTVDLEKALAKLLGKGKTIIGAAGENPENPNLILKLSETVMGKVSGVKIIGELDGKGNLAPRSNYGPEMTDKRKPPPGLQGSSFSSVMYTSDLVKKLISKASIN
jgi:hypothetical protein